MRTDFYDIFFRPSDYLIRFDKAKSKIQKMPWLLWMVFIGIFIGSSFLYEKTFYAHLGVKSFLPTSFVISCTGALAWCFFGLMLFLVTQKNIFVCAHAFCLTLFYGTLILLGFVFIHNALLKIHSLVSPIPSNIIMAILFSWQLKKVDVPFYLTFLLWNIALNGVWMTLLFFAPHMDSIPSFK